MGWGLHMRASCVAGGKTRAVTDARGLTSDKETPIMLCYSCAEQAVDRPAVALCRSCSAGLCMEHLRATASHLASSHVLDACQHDTWIATGPPARSGEPFSGSRR
jgi:hypothetical protein